MMNLGKKVGFAALLTLSSVSAQAGMLALDSFDYKVDLEVGAATTDTASVNNFNIFGGDAEYTLIQGAAGEKTSASTVNAFNVSKGKLSISNDTDAFSTLEIFYSELDGCLTDAICPPLPLFGEIDFTGGGAFDSFYFDVISIDKTFSISITVFNDDLTDFWASANDVGSHTGNSSTYTAPSSGATGQRTISFGDALWSGNADFTKTTGILLSISGVIDSDLSVGEFGVIPEPSTVAIFGLALVGFAFSSRRKAK